ncbi:hypothetical protein INR49_022822, partial [Caranx melampygus]
HTHTHLIHTLIHWRSVNGDSLDLEQEVDPLTSTTSPARLMWACALGHQRAAELLYSWNGLALGIPDSLGRLPLAVARSRGHTRSPQLWRSCTHSTHTHTRRPGTHTRRSHSSTVPLSTSPDLVSAPPAASLTSDRPPLPAPPTPGPAHGHLPLLSLLSFLPSSSPPRCPSPRLCLLPVPPFPPPCGHVGGWPRRRLQHRFEPQRLHRLSSLPHGLRELRPQPHTLLHTHTAVRGAHAAASWRNSC